jgi:F-type H+-transporting ATPase subunit gamma
LRPLETATEGLAEASPRSSTAKAEGLAEAASGSRAAEVDYIYEPSPERILELLLRQLVHAQILRALVESNAAFYAAQMTAMDAATRNSSEMLQGLTLYMNKLRQAAITREIIEVVSGAQAL